MLDKGNTNGKKTKIRASFTCKPNKCKQVCTNKNISTKRKTTRYFPSVENTLVYDEQKSVSLFTLLLVLNVRFHIVM